MKSQQAPQADKQPVLEAVEASRDFTVRAGIFRRPEKLRAVDSVSFQLASGESLGLVGESGCGKSTLGRMACGLLRPSAGALRFQGRDLPPAGARSWAAGRVQMIFQDPASSLDPRMTVASSIAEPLLAHGLKRGEAFARANKLLEVVGLAGMGKRYPHQFSGGQRQRIAVGRAIATHPDVIVCDEPVSALDASVQAQILNLLRDVQSEFGQAYLFISHDLAVVGFVCARILVMYLGQIVEEANRDQLFSHAAHPYSRALLAAMPQGAEAWAEGKAHLPPPISGELPSPIHPPSGCYFHPRCPIAQPVCETVQPPWKQMAPGWRARCHFAGEIPGA